MSYFNRLRPRLLIGIFFVILIGFGAASYVVYREYLTHEIDRSIVDFDSVLKQMNMNIDLNMESLKDLASNLYFNECIQNQLQHDYSKTSTSYDQFLFTSEVNKLITFNSNVLGVQLYSINGPVYYFGQGRSKLISTADLRKQPWFSAINGTRGQYIYISGVKEYFINQKSGILLLAREILSPDFSIVLGYQLISVDTGFMKTIFSNSLSPKKGIIAVIDKEGKEIITSNSMLEYPDTQQLINVVYKNIFSDKSLFTFKKDTFIWRKSISSNTGFSTLGLIPLKELEFGVRDTILGMLVAVVVGLVLSMVLSGLVTRSIVQPIKRLSRTMKDVQLNDMQINIPSFQLIEINEMAVHFSKMLVRLKDAFNHLANQRLLNQKLENELLISQMNPHFLYNTLNTIYWMILLDKDKNETASMVSSLSDLLKYGLNHTDEEVTIGEELIQANRYIFIQMNRFKDRMNWSAEIDHQLHHCRIIKFVFQPLLENSIYHGVEKSAEMTNVTLKGYLDNQTNDIVLEFYDDGIGIGEARLKEIHAYLKASSGAVDDKLRISIENVQGIGLINVHRRIQLAYGSSYGLFVSSLEGQWTKITVRIPQFSYGGTI